jgi:hypothetical protein
LLVSLPVVSLLLSLPFVFTYSVQQLTRLWMRLVFPIGQQEFPNYLKVVYAYLPLTLGANLAYYIPTAITESGTLLPTLARSLGFSGNLLPTLTWSLDVANFLQGAVLLWSFAFSVYILFAITKRLLKSNLPHILLMLGLTAVFFPLMVL